MKLVSQKKMNAIFIGGLIGFVSISALTVMIAFSRQVTGSASSSDKVEQVEVNPVEVDNRFQEFLDGYVATYLVT